MARQFLIASLITAGFGQTNVDQDRLAAVSAGGPNDNFISPIHQPFARIHTFNMGGHRSHSSHSSHRSSSAGSGHFSHSSHTSHRSSASGGYDYPSAPAPAVPVYTDPSPSDGVSGSYDGGSSGGRSSSVPAPAQGFISPRPATGGADGRLPSMPGRSQRFKMAVCRVQLALTARDYYAGPIDCVVGPQLRGAIRKFQADQSIDQTGTITPEVLDRLMVPTE